MLNLAGTRACCHYCITLTHKHACTHTHYVLIMIFYVRVPKLMITCLLPLSICAGLFKTTQQIFYSSESSLIQSSASVVSLIICHFTRFSLQSELQ